MGVLQAKTMTREDIQLLIDSGSEIAEVLALAIVAIAKVGSANYEQRVDLDTLNLIADTLSIQPEPYRSWGIAHRQIRLSFMEVDAVIYARVQR